MRACGVHASDFTDFTDHMHVSSTRALDTYVYEGAGYIVEYMVVCYSICSSVRRSAVYMRPLTLLQYI